jgi:hypothetical protein
LQDKPAIGRGIKQRMMGADMIEVHLDTDIDVDLDRCRCKYSDR